MKHTKILDQLLIWLAESPNDPFLLYGIATEYRKTEAETAVRYYEKLLENFPDYVATYYHAASLYAEIGETEKARKTYEKGIEICKKLNENKLLAELRNAYEDFLDNLE
ncbi:MAG: tetratricopeptide repeat protein [Bacteroidetes bacterium]|nr:MAG: tetratricopeptide repeat protein [Bacteroidota bacterium]